VWRKVTLLNIKDEFLRRTVNWQEKLDEDEWFFARLYEDLTKNLTPEECFNLIPQAVELTLEQSNDFLCTECFEYVIGLSVRSKTTEINPYLEDKWDILIRHVSSFGDYHKNQAEELKRWYRKR
jgi:hypothetical protein